MTQKVKNLVWSPIGPQLVDHIQSDRSIRLLIAPFMQHGALLRLLDILPPNSEMKVITRWNSSDIASGASDPRVYEELVKNKIPLYIHNHIHLKLIILDDGSCFVSSANVTGRGLGFCECPNVEAGAWSHLAYGDWIELYRIINDSNLVDENVYAAALKYRDENLHQAPPLPELELPILRTKNFTLASLPASDSPDKLFCCCYQDEGKKLSDDPRTEHDLAILGVDPSIPKELFLTVLGERFRAQPFVQVIAKRIRERGNMRFGEVTAWIHDHCEDVPIPYRWEVKTATNILYNWLSYFFEELEWSVPGDRSQVIYWKSQTN